MRGQALSGCLIAVAAPGGESSARSRIEALRRAGADARVSMLGQNLWSLLSDAAFDLVVVLPERDDVASLTVYDQLRDDPRTRGIPMLLLTNQSVRTRGRGAIALSAEVDDDAFVAALADLAAPRHRLREAEQHERTLREELRLERVRSEQHVMGLADLSHELRAMLGAILGFGCNLRDEVPGPLSLDQKTHVAGILDAVERAAKLLEKARGTATSGMHRAVVLPQASAPPRGQRTLVHLARSASEVAALFDAIARRKGVRLQCSCDDTVCSWGDALKLKQVLTNLVMNAVKYTPAGGEINVNVAWSQPNTADGPRARRMAEIVVSDTGPGIAPEHRERVFARGFRVPGHSDIEGEGIGLAVVKEIVGQHGGMVRVEGEPGQGAIFRVRLLQDRRQRSRDIEPGEGE